MNEASSKYVDQIAVEKLLNEKLKRVHHAPDSSGIRVDASFADFDQLPQLPHSVSGSAGERMGEWTFPSFVRSKDEENDIVKCRFYSSENPKGEVIFVHGLYEDNLALYDAFLTELNDQGMGVCFMMLPYHYGRQPKGSSFSGEFFWSADLERSALAFKQAVYDLYQLFHHARHQSGRPVWIVGFSMGGGIALSLAALTPLDGVFVINPVCNISDLVWHSPLFSTIRADLEANGITFEHVKARYSQVDPLNARHVRTDRERIVLVKSLYDQINDPENYTRLTERWAFKNILTYKAGHLNVLRVPRLAADVAHFCLESRRHELL